MRISNSDFTSQFSTVSYHAFLASCSCSWSDRFKSVENFITFSYISKYNVFAIKMRSFHKAEEELWSIGARSSIGHWQNASTSVSVGEVFIFEFPAINAFTTSSVSSREITTLSHKARNDSMEFASFEMEWLALCTCTLFSCAKRTEVFRCFWSVSFKLYRDAASGWSTNWYVKKDFSHLI